MIYAFLTGKLFGLARWTWLLAALVVLAVIIAILSGREAADDKANQNLGATTERSRGLEKTLERTVEGNAAREEIRAPDRAGACARYDQCLRSSRPSAAGNCGRFLPELSSGHGCPGTVPGR